MSLKYFRTCREGSISIALVILLCLVAGCIQGDEGGDKGDGSVEGAGIPSGVQLRFDPEVSASLFRARGTIELLGGGSLPYVILDANLMRDGSAVENTKYMIMDVEAGREYPFDISENIKLPDGAYSCVLGVRGPEGPIANETRVCRVAASLASPYGEKARQDADLVRPPYDFAKFYEMGREDALEEVEREQREEEEEDLEISVPEETEGEVEDPDEALKEFLEDSTGTDSGSGEFVASSTGEKYHSPDCSHVSRIKPENLVRFDSVEEAEAQGYEPCKVCNP